MNESRIPRWGMAIVIILFGGYWLLQLALWELSPEMQLRMRAEETRVAFLKSTDYGPITSVELEPADEFGGPYVAVEMDERYAHARSSDPWDSSTTSTLTETSTMPSPSTPTSTPPQKESPWGSIGLIGLIILGILGTIARIMGYE